ncbi:MAG TPA: acylhydrolase [Rikenellaceae bacterium]|nr:acylhydrolase [Rikenellaceae bacterium]
MKNKLTFFIVAVLVSVSCRHSGSQDALSISKHNPTTPDWAYTHVYAPLRDTITQRPLAIFYGDSITEGWVDDEFFSSHNSIPMGVSGMTTCQLLCRFRTDVINLKPKYVAIMCGTNDIAQNIGEIELETAAGNIVSMCELARYNGIIPLVCSVTPCTIYRWRMKLGNPTEKIKSFNALLKEYCMQSGVQYVDYYSALDSGDGSLAPDMTRDECHLTPKAYKVMEKVIAPFLK